jgi:hypothetical protein
MSTSWRRLRWRNDSQAFVIANSSGCSGFTPVGDSVMSRRSSLDGSTPRRHGGRLRAAINKSSDHVATSKTGELYFR